MSHRIRRLLFWTPRGTLALLAVLLPVFALDAFGAGYDLWQTLVAMLIHLAPAAGMLVILALAWRWPLLGTIALSAWATWYTWETCGQFPPSVYAIVAGLPLVQAMLFFLNRWLQDEVGNRT